MKYLSLCSGIEAASTAWHQLGWKPFAFSEIEAFPSAVLKHHWPDVPNFGDMTKFESWQELHEVDLLVGGTPCQAFSVAGLRNSLSDERGNLTLTYVQILNKIDHERNLRSIQPAICLWENVPGVLNTKDNAFGCFLGALAGEELPLEPPGGRWTNAGYVRGPQRTIAWRVLDAQYFGVAQRRRRVFVVASAREGFNPEQILFEFDSMRRDSAPSRKTGQETTADTGDSTKNGCRSIAARMTAFGEYVEDETASCMKQRDYKDATDLVAITQFGDIAGSLTARHDSSPCADRGMNMVAFTQNTRDEVRIIGGDGQITGALAASSGMKQTNYVCSVGFNGDQSEKTHSMGEQEEQSPTLRSCRPPHVAYGIDEEWNGTEELFGTLKARMSGGGFQGSVAIPIQDGRGMEKGQNGLGVGVDTDPAYTLDQTGAQAVCAVQGTVIGRHDTAGPQGSGADDSGCMYTLTKTDVHAVATPYAVRRLTPVECHRLQGFPDNHCQIPWRGKAAEDCPDGPQYKALGNSMAVPVMAWIGKRIDLHLFNV